MIFWAHWDTFRFTLPDPLDPSPFVPPFMPQREQGEATRPPFCVRTRTRTRARSIGLALETLTAPAALHARLWQPANVRLHKLCRRADEARQKSAKDGPKMAGGREDGLITSLRARRRMREEQGGQLIGCGSNAGYKTEGATHSK